MAPCKNKEDAPSSTPKGTGRWQNLMFAMLPVAFAILFFYPVIFQGKTFYAFDILMDFSPWAKLNNQFKAHNPLISDPVNIFYPYAYHLKSAVREGNFPLWNPAVFAGSPYPPPTHPLMYVLFLLFPMTAAHDFLLLLHLGGIGLFMYLYLREIGLDPSSSIIGAAAWMFNGYVMVWFEFENVPMMAFSLPFTLFIFELWLKKRTRVNYMYLILAMALSISVNCAHLLIYQIIFLALYCSWRFWSTYGKNPLRWREWGKLLGAALLAVCVSANFFTLHLSFMEDPQRSYFSFESLFRLIGRLPKEYLVTLIFPDFYGSPVLPLCFTPANQSYGNYNELCIYGGIPVLLLASACIPYLRKRFVAFYLIAALIAVSMAMGSILYYPLAVYVPGLNMSTPTRILYIFGFCFSVLAALGNQMLLGGSDSRRKWVLALWFAVLVFATGAVIYVQTDQGLLRLLRSIQGLDIQRMYPAMRDFFHPLSPVLLKPLLLLGVSVYLLSAFLFSKKKIFQKLLLLVLLYDLMSFGLSYNTAVPRQLEYPETKGIRFLQDDPEPFRVITYGSFLHNFLVPFRIQDAGGYSSFYPKRYGDFLHLSQHGSDAPLPSQHSRWVFWKSLGSPLLDLINVKYLVTSPNLTIHSDMAELVYDGEIRIYRNKGAFPRAFFVPQFQVIDNREDVYRKIAGFSREDFRERVILESPPPRAFHGSNKDAAVGQNAHVKIVSYQANRVELDVSSDRDGFVVMGDNFHPGWKAFLDDQEIPVIRANYIMRAVPVDQGKHRLVLWFKPRLLIAGVALSAVGWFLMLLYFSVALLSRLRKAGRK